MNAGFVARAFAGNIDQTAEIIKQAVLFEGYALVDILQPCVTFNKVNSYQWFKDNTYTLDETHDPKDRHQAFEKATETDRLALGILYKNPDKSSFEENTGLYKEDKRPLFERTLDMERLRVLMNQFRVMH